MDDPIRNREYRSLNLFLAPDMTVFDVGVNVVGYAEKAMLTEPCVKDHTVLDRLRRHIACLFRIYFSERDMTKLGQIIFSFHDECRSAKIYVSGDLAGCNLIVYHEYFASMGEDLRLKKSN
tara:strand:+ start:518 stop:880 length:363 start_codon:yes stop_codon:yes gene_type:complete